MLSNLLKCCSFLERADRLPLRKSSLARQSWPPGPERRAERAKRRSRTPGLLRSCSARLEWGRSGYAKPNSAQIAKTRNIPAKQNSVCLDTLISGESVSRAKLVISMRKSRTKKKQGKRDRRRGWIRTPHHDQIKGEFEDHRRSDGPHDRAPMAVPSPLRCVRKMITKKAMTAEVRVTGVIGFASAWMRSFFDAPVAAPAQAHRC